MTGLDDAGVDRSDGNLEHTLTGDGPEWVEITWRSRYRTVEWKILPKCPGPVRPVVMQRYARWVRMPHGNEAEEVHDLTFEPVPGGMAGCDGWKRWRRRVDGRHDTQESTEMRQRPQV